MSISAISSNQVVLDPTLVPPGGPTGNLQNLASSFNTLGQALQSGDLNAAQQAFTSLLQSVPSAGAPAAGSAGPDNSASSAGADIVSLGQALQSGNLPAAQQAFASLQQAVQSHGPAHGAGHAHKAQAGGSSSDAASGADSDPASSTVVSETTITNANGTLTVTSTYADGTTSTAILPNPNPTYANNKLDPNNNGQGATLLAAQEQSTPIR